MHRLTLPCALALVAALLPGAGRAADPEAMPGARLFHQHCAACHEGQQPGAPAKQFLQMMPSSSIVGALTSGMMAEEGRSLTAADKEQVAQYLTGGGAGASAL